MYSGPELWVWAVSLLTTDFITRSLTAGKHLYGILSLLEFSKLTPPSSDSALPPLNSLPTLALKLFRGEPAISKFVWNFTASHTSSPVIATNVGSDLHGALPPLHPGHG